MKANNGKAPRNTMRAIKLGLAGVAMLVAVGQAQAGSITYTIEDIGTFPDYAIANTGQSYLGTGFVGLYETTTLSIHKYRI